MPYITALNKPLRLLLCICAVLFNACSNCPGGGEGNLTFGRRPPVMIGSPECVLDYGSALEEASEDNDQLECIMDNFIDEDAVWEPLHKDLYNLYKPPVEEFHLSKGDIVEVFIYGEDDSYYEQITIAPDGCLYYAFIEGIPAAGRTLEAVNADLEKALEKYYKHPRVIINLRTSVSMSWKIFGKVQKPGVYLLEGPITLRQAIGVAGGLAVESYEFKNTNGDLETLADLDNSFMIRNNKKLEIDFRKLIHNADHRNDIFIKPGDYIYIAAIPYREVYVLGNVKAPARLQYDDDMTLMQAIAEAGGWPIGGPLSADVTNCLVIRGDLDNPCVVRCDLSLIAYGEAKDFYLVPGDIIYVHNKTLRFARGLVTLAINTFLQSFATTSGSYYANNKWFFIPGETTDSSSSSESD